MLLGLFVLQERRAAEPILPLRMFRNRVFTLTSGIGFIVGLGMFGAIVFLPLFLQVVTGVSATNSGLLLVPMMLGVLTGSIGSGRRITTTGRYKRYPVAGTAIMAVGLFLLSTMDPTTSLPVVSVFMATFGFGLGLVMQVLVIAVQNSVELSDLGVATSSTTFFRSLGGAFGTALFGAIFSSRLATNLIAALPPGSGPPGDLTRSPALIAQLPPELHAPVVASFSDAITRVFTVGIPFAVVAFAMVLILPELPLRETAHVGASTTADPMA